jgi:hypothetical protein
MFGCQVLNFQNTFLGDFYVTCTICKNCNFRNKTKQKTWNKCYILVNYRKEYRTTERRVMHERKILTSFSFHTTAENENWLRGKLRSL